MRSNGYLENQVARSLNILVSESDHYQYLPRLTAAISKQIEIQAKLKEISDLQARIHEYIQLAPNHWSSYVSEDS